VIGRDDPVARVPMRAFLSLVLGLVVALGAWPGAAAPARAPAGPAAAAPMLPAQLGGDLAAIKVGHWAEYVVADLRRKSTLRLKLAVVERSRAGTWTELSLRMPGAERLIIKTLIKGDSRNPSAVQRVILKAGHLQPVEIVGGPPGEAAPRYRSTVHGTTRRLGREAVRVPAGTVSADHYRWVGKDEVADSWSSVKVPLFGLVKFKSRDYIMELAGSGTDARPEITGRVGKLDLATLKGAAPSQPSR
jgi:hypothetical protein